MAVPLLCLGFFGCILWVILIKFENQQLKTDLDKVTKRLKHNLKHMTDDVRIEGGSSMSKEEVGATDKRIQTGHRV